MRTCSRWIWAIALLPLIGCGDRQPKRTKVYPTRGAVFYHGKPAVGAIVRAHGVEGAGGSAIPRAVVRKDGTFSFMMYEADDGIPAGRYRISIYWRLQSPDGEQEGPSLIPERYSRPELSGLEVEIKAEAENLLPTFYLTP